MPLDNTKIVSRVFTVKKSNGKDRMIIDLSELNKIVNKVHFKMEGLETIKGLLQPDDYMMSIDLSNAFFSIPLHNSSKPLTAFEFDGHHYVYNVLPFGLTSSPRIFSKMLRPVIIWLRSQGLKITSYLDDIFLCHNSQTTAKEHVSLVLDTLLSLGFIPNYSKSSLVPSKSLLHLGFFWNSSEMSLSLPVEKIVKTKQFASRLLSQDMVSLREVSSFLGLLVSHTNGLKNGPLHFRFLQLQFVFELKFASSWEKEFVLDSRSIEDLSWWSVDFHCVPVDLLPFSPEIVLHTDASLSGWGGTLCSGSVAFGKWSPSESQLHINYLELKAIYFCLRCFSSEIEGKSLQIFSDNSTSVSYLNRMGGTHSSSLCSLSLKIWSLIHELGADIQAVHIAGTSNQKADFFSRADFSCHEYSLSQSTFDDLLDNLHISLEVDVFASRLNYKLPCYFSRYFDPYSSSVNAFSSSWPRSVYMFPPINLIGKTLSKFCQEKVDIGILVTPAWPGMPEVPVLVKLLFSDPFLIPDRFLEGDRPTRYPFLLAAWPISTSTSRTQAFRLHCESRCSRVWQNQHLPSMSSSGKNFIAGLQKVGINCQFLYKF